MDIPNLLTKKELLEPLNIARSRINDIKSKINNHADNSLELQGLFALMISQLEVMFTDVLKYYLRHFPQKFSDEEIKIKRKEIIDAIIPFNIIEDYIDKRVYSEGYKNFNTMLLDFCKTLSIDNNKISSDLIQNIIEIKETRNLLIHNNLIVNNLYLFKSGQCKRSNKKGDRLKITKKYADDSCNHTISLIDIIIKELLQVYGHYTKIEALKELWSFLFSSPVMPFDDFWKYDLTQDRICGMKKGQYEDGLASSEYKLLGLWRAHSNGDTAYLKDFNMFELDKTNQKKVLYFLSIVDDFRLRE